jgi:hypothetical protein
MHSGGSDDLARFDLGGNFGMGRAEGDGEAVKAGPAYFATVDCRGCCRLGAAT